MLCLLVSLAAEVPTARGQSARAMLVHPEPNVSSSFHAVVFSALRAAVNQNAAAPVTLNGKNLDLRRFNEPRCEEGLENHLRVKYEGRPITVIVMVGAAALDFAPSWWTRL
ncbi:hypothetical protein GCM10007874_47060 [Labrys miyagiensis]|uniref:Uncharacterized protein n=1 Tax=Labrys miyagiensis TaxID=346912 RepID=A0ABQ6CSH8_9HYPH|nr:hypothetical protein GCM10007874_47060 [Labrys miyagiensis]